MKLKRRIHSPEEPQNPIFLDPKLVQLRRDTDLSAKQLARVPV